MDSISTIKAGEFSWSISRNKIYESCRRAYYLRYYAALGGHEQYSGEERPLLYRLKNLRSPDAWLKEIFAESLRETFHQGQFFPTSSEAARELEKQMLKKFSRGRGEALSGCWIEDPKRVNLQEIYYNEADPDIFFKEQFKRLKETFIFFVNTDIFEQLCRIDSLNWKRIPLPAACTLRNFKIWLAPAIIWSGGGRVTALNITSGGGRTAGALAALMLHQKTRIPFERIDILSLNWYEHELEWRNHTVKEVRMELAGVMRSARRMLHEISPDGYVHEKNFADNHDNCPRCIFREFCEKRRLDLTS